MSKLKLSIATTDYDHFRDFRLGIVKAEGIDHNWLDLGHRIAAAIEAASRAGNGNFAGQPGRGMARRKLME